MYVYIIYIYIILYTYYIYIHSQSGTYGAEWCMNAVRRYDVGIFFRINTCNYNHVVFSASSVQWLILKRSLLTAWSSY